MENRKIRINKLYNQSNWRINHNNLFNATWNSIYFSFISISWHSLFNQKKMNSLYTYLLVSAILFCLGLYGVTTRRNALLILMSIELILSSANINLVAFSRFVVSSLDGQIFALFAIVITLVQAAVGIAIILNVYLLFHQ